MTRPPGPLDAETILAATEDVLRRHGPAKATVVDVGRVLGVSHTAVYKYFPSKAALREAVARRWLDRGLDGLAAIAHDEQSAPAERLHAWLAALLATKRARATDDPELFAAARIVVYESGGAQADHVNALLGQLRDILADGMATGAFRSADPAEVARVVFIATNSFHHPAHVTEWSRPGIEQELDAVCSLILGGLASRAG